MTARAAAEVHATLRRQQIAILDDLASPERLRRYQRDVPRVAVPLEILEQWGDMAGDRPDELLQPPFSAGEIDAIRRFDVVYERTPRPPDDLEEWLRTPEYAELAAAAIVCRRAYRADGAAADGVTTATA